MMKMFPKTGFLLCALLLAMPVMAQAGGTLALSNADGKDKVMLSYEQLAAMPATEFYTSTPWTDGVQKFRGVAFSQLFDAHGITADTVRVSALNDYSVIVPVRVLRDDHAILAYQLNGGEMSVRDKGPFWVVFPYDSDERLRTDTFWSYSVWQVKSIDGQN